MNIIRCDHCKKEEREPVVHWLGVHVEGIQTPRLDEWPGPWAFCSWRCVAEYAKADDAGYPEETAWVDPPTIWGEMRSGVDDFERAMDKLETLSEAIGPYTPSFDQGAGRIESRSRNGDLSSDSPLRRVSRAVRRACGI